MQSETDRIYMDFAATTPLDEEVKQAMAPYFSDKFGNPGSLHGLGQEAIKAVDESRETVAASISADFREVVFTGSATEANNLSLRGALKRFRENMESDSLQKPKVIVSEIEHESVIDTAYDLGGDVEVETVGVDERGVIDLDELEGKVDERTVLVSVMYANNELGTVQPISGIAQIVKEEESVYPILHTDAVQAFQYLDCDVEDLGVDLMTISGHKIYGPKGIGALYVRKPSDFAPDEHLLSPLVTGGGQEFNLRSGTENVPSIAGFAKAVEVADRKREEELRRVSDLGNYFWSELREKVEGVEINGLSPQERIGEKVHAIPNIYNIYFPNRNNEDFLIKLDMENICVSTGSACSARSVEESHVLKALNLPQDKIDSSLRFSFGRPTTRKDVDEVINRINNI